ncbi:MAG: type I restriction endonuclease subunit R [Limosilactobacillus sp.]|uniref:type I restriction endonuclease subunit R n=1 Tax=Limosilactobacillus sp. TaxID=2773925 RepID=UPI0027096190|nr:type I restriction endonuclease subunit R [Limosilactobacillus sp.]
MLHREDELEVGLINQLVQGESQWTFRKDLNTEQKLWDNFFDILERNNKDKLNDVPLSEKEKDIIKTKVSHSNFFSAGQFLSGANNQVRVQVTRDDSKLGVADLLVLDNHEIAGGNSVYEVVRQVQMPRREMLDMDRRFDVTLVINGLPLIHIELKKPGNSIHDAFVQIGKYIAQGQFEGLYSNVQMFVISNGQQTKYFAANQQLNEQFESGWVDINNEPVLDLQSFAKDVLSIPMAHRMIADYTVLDSDSRTVMLLRPYQIHAIEALREASKRRQSGYIWHTTGSGKTLTSYKAARNLLSIPSIDKTVFLIDRRDLDAQTTQAYTTYANNDSIEVGKTDSTSELRKALLSGERRVIVTTRQKFDHLIKFVKEGKLDDSKAKKLKDLNLAFIIDECHRTVTPDLKKAISTFFHHEALWYGFTGTPIFDENARAEKGSNERTTEQLFGPCLHTYNIKNAIRDKAVLGFQVKHMGSESVVDENDTKKLDLIYRQPEHMRNVVKSILRMSFQKLGMNDRSRRGYTYAALFTTSSIKQAQEYYKIFRGVIEGDEEYADIKVPEKVKKVLPDFPKVAITYSVDDSQNGDEVTDNEEEMKRSIEDYNKEFHQSFTFGEREAYNRDVNNRLARKKKQYLSRDQQLDIVIVVDRLLTGFDSKPLSTLFIDRQPMNPQNLIQAFSRTNRLCDGGKKYGQIVTFQYPDQFQDAVENAISLYTQGSTSDIMAPSWHESKQKLDQAVSDVKAYHIEPGEIPSIVDAEEEDQIAFLKEYRKLDRALAAIYTYDEFEDDSLEKEYGLDQEHLDYMKSIYEDVVESVKAKKTDDDDDEPIDLSDYELEAMTSTTINYEYILKLMQSFVPEVGELFAKETDEEKYKEIDQYIDQLSAANPVLGESMKKLWDRIKTDPENYRGKQVDQLLEGMLGQARLQSIQEYAEENCLNVSDLEYVINNYNPNNDAKQQVGIEKLLSDEAFDAFKNNGGSLAKFKWKKQMRAGVEKLYQDKINPIDNRE